MGRVDYNVLQMSRTADKWWYYKVMANKSAPQTISKIYPYAQQGKVPFIINLGIIRRRVATFITIK